MSKVVLKPVIPYFSSTAVTLEGGIWSAQTEEACGLLKEDAAVCWQQKSEQPVLHLQSLSVMISEITVC